MRRPSLVSLIALFLIPFASYTQQKATQNISAVYAEGKISGSEYKNEYFGLTLNVEPGHFTQGGFVSPDGNRARLIDAQNNAPNRQDRFEIAVLADSLGANPLVHAPEQYVRAVRHQFEKEGMETEKTESPLQVSGVPFVQALLKVNDGGTSHYRAICTTFLNGYILSLDVSASTPEKISELVTRAVGFKATSR